MDVNSAWIPTWHQMDHVTWSLGLSYSQKPSLGGKPNTKPGDHGTPDPLFYSIISWVRTHVNRNSLKQHLVEGLVTYGITLHSRVCDHTSWFWRCIGTAFAHSLMGSHNVMVTAFGSWPLKSFEMNQQQTHIRSPLYVIWGKRDYRIQTYLSFIHPTYATQMLLFVVDLTPQAYFKIPN